MGNHDGYNGKPNGATGQTDWAPLEAAVRQHLERLCSAENPRFWERETQTADYVEDALANMGVPFASENYEVEVPRWDDWALSCDGSPVDCLPCCLAGGRLDGAPVVDATAVETWGAGPAISANPHCAAPSVVCLFDGPAVAVSPSVAKKILDGGKVEGFVNVSRYRLPGRNIVIGDPETCERLVVCHYDSYWGGAMDDGVGVAAMLVLAPKLLDKKYCLLFGGTEEASFETPYWCAGYRAFERAHPTCLANVKDILVLDAFGHRENAVWTGPKAAEAAFKVLRDDVAEKVRLYTSPREIMLSNYQTRTDLPDKIDALDLGGIWRLITG